MPTFQFGPWRPDLPELNNPGILEATNVVQEVGSFEPQFGLVGVSASLTVTVLGAFACLDKAGNVNWFAGTATDLWRMTQLSQPNWSLVGTGYTLTPDDRWEFAKYGERIFAAASTEDLQSITLSLQSTFASVVGAPRSRHIAVVKNFLTVASTAVDPQRVQWSGLDAPDAWTPSAVTQADFQDIFGDGGWNQGIVVGLAGSDAVIIQEHAVWRMMYVGTPLIFQFDLVEAARGSVSPGSIVQSGGFAFYISDNGFFQFDGTSSAPIGRGKVDKFFLGLADATSLKKVTSVADIRRPLVYWGFPTTGGTTVILAYNWQVQEWTLIEENFDILWRLLDFDAPVGSARTAAFDTGHRACAFTGPAKEATITTADYQFTMGRSRLTEIYPQCEGDLPAASVGHRPIVTQPPTFTAATPANALAFCPQRIDDRFMRLRFQQTQGAAWSRWKGFKIEPQASGWR